jgi:hypothetical protein
MLPSVGGHPARTLLLLIFKESFLFLLLCSRHCVAAPAAFRASFNSLTFS